MQIKVFQVRFMGQIILESIREREAQNFVNDLYNDEKKNPTRIVPELWEDWRESVDHTEV